MMDASADRKERRNWWAGVAVITAFALLGTVSLGYGLYRPSPASSSSAAPADPTPQVRYVAVSFPDERSGHLVVAICDDPSVDETCETELRVTADAGQSWRRRELPKVNGDPVGLDAGFELLSLGAGRLVIDAPGGFDSNTGRATEPGYRFFSDDGGQSWEKRPRKPSGAVTEVPENGWLFYPVPDPADRADDTDSTLAPQVISPDGTAATLSKGPRYAAPSTTPVTFASDGSIWALGAEPPSMSHDHGRTWQKVGLPKLDSGVQGLVRTSDGAHVFVITGSSDGIAGIWSAADGGRKWRELSLPKPSGASSSDKSVSFAEVPDGSFLMQTSETLYRYTTSSGDPTEVPLPGVVFAAIAPVHGGVVAVTGDDMGGATYYLTVDGIHWMPIPLRVAG
jgi:hypothetical protein